ncbi:site-specific DNA-methyltransferase [Streptomyces coeruleorubidus]|uniref:site-specific DNA-methyltransferase n=1 Tax=Streptomyces coeruleorubidus TaxID=116188 RepID=UPI001E45E131|nr:site-specific DNA-methyltransferase [Streptomyces bellus]
MTIRVTMHTVEPGDPETHSKELVAENLEQLRKLFPSAFTEGKVDFDALRELLGDAVDDGDEKFGLTWFGKRNARRIALKPSTATLLPRQEESVDWDTTRNIMIEGDNLEVLKLLQKSYANKVKLIYIDPPYNTGKDFIYPDSFQDSIRSYLELTGQTHSGGGRISSNAETSGRYHSAWLDMMYPRLTLARNLLADNGLIIVSIDDHEVHNLRALLDEIFGGENFIGSFVWKRKAGGGDDSGHIAIEHEYLLCYGRRIESVKLARIKHESPAMTAKYNRSENGRRYYLERLDKTSLTYSSALDFEIECPDGTWISPPQNDPDNPTTIWRWSKSKVVENRSELEFHRDKKTGEWRIYTRTWESLDGVTARSLLVDAEHGRNRDGTQELISLFGGRVFTNPKPVKMLKHLLRIAASDADSIVLDFFAGSGSVAHALMEMNDEDGGRRRFILVQLPESTGRSDYATISEITRARLRKVGEKLSDSPGAGDFGFRSFSLSEGNIVRWDTSRPDFEQQAFEHIENVREGRSEQDILFELLLNQGLDLASSVDTRTFAGVHVFATGGGLLFAVLPPVGSVYKGNAEEIAQGIIAWRNELQPEADVTVFLKDVAFADDVAKANLVAILEQHESPFVVKCL